MSMIVKDFDLFRVGFHYSDREKNTVDRIISKIERVVSGVFRIVAASVKLMVNLACEALLLGLCVPVMLGAAYIAGATILVASYAVILSVAVCIPFAPIIIIILMM
ncbi:MAG: hypothetical protein V4489_06075 [Chlamydiota bacterium]